MLDLHRRGRHGPSHPAPGRSPLGGSRVGLLVGAALLCGAPLSPQEDPSAPRAEGSGATRAGEAASRPAGHWAFVREVRDVDLPADAAIDERGRIFVLESGAHRVSVFDERGERKAVLGSGPGSADGELLDPRGLALGPEGTVWVADTGNHRVQVFGPTGEWMTSIGARGRETGRFDRPQGIDVAGGRLYVADTRNDRVQVLDLDGEPQLVVGAFGTGEGELDGPLDVVAGAEGGFYVLDGGNSRFQRFGPEGRFVAAFGDWGSFAGLLDGPAGACRSGARLFVAERYNHRVQVFSLEGEPIEEWGLHAVRPREGAGKLHYPSNVAVDSTGTLAVVCEGFENRFQLFRRRPEPAEGPVLDPSLVGSGGAPHYGRRIDSAGDLLVILEPVTHSVLLFDLAETDPVLIHTLGGRGRRYGRFVLPSDAVLDAERWQLWVVDRGNRRLQCFGLSHRPSDRLRYVPDMSRLLRSVELDGVLPPDQRRGPVEPVAVEHGGDGKLYVLDARGARVIVLDADYRFAGTFGSWGSGPGQLREPSDFAWDPTGRWLYVVDAHNRRLAVFDREGEHRFDFGGPEADGGGLVRPFGVSVARDGKVFVTDAGAHRVAVFGPKGEHLRTFGTEGLGAAEFYRPAGIVHDQEQRAIVLDYGNHRGQIFDAASSFVRAFGARLFVEPTRPVRRPPAVDRD